MFTRIRPFVTAIFLKLIYGVIEYFDFLNYWKTGRAHFDEVELISIADFNARQTALVSRKVDVISRCDLKTLNLLAKRPGVRVEETTGFLHYTVPMITTIAPFDNNDVRLALKYAVDREQLLQRVLHGHHI